MFKRIFLILLLILFCSNLFAQVSGISNSKVIVISPEVVDKHLLEFEPAFLYSLSSERWNENSKLIHLIDNQDNRLSMFDFGFRLTYGAFKNFEIGSVIPSDMSAVLLGAKYKFLSSEKFIFAGFTGVNFNNETYGVFDKEAKGVNTVESGLGIVGKYNFNENLSVDLDAQYLSSVIRGDENHSGDVYINSELGYYAGDYQFCAGLSYYNGLYNDEEEKSELLSLVIGGTVETAEDFVIIWGVPYDIYGKSIEKSLGFLLAFTITIK